MIHAKLPHIKLQFRLCTIVSLIQMKQFEIANNEMKDIGYFDDPKNICETYHAENLYLDHKGNLHILLLFNFCSAVYDIRFHISPYDDCDSIDSSRIIRTI
jgi:hypothetical protein